MKIPIYLYSNLQRYTDGQIVVESEGSTVGQCLEHLTHKYPEIAPTIFDKSGIISSLVYISVNLESPSSEVLERSLSEGDRIYIILIVAGG